MATATKERRKARSGGTTLSVADLKRCLGAVAPAVAARGPKPVLSNVLLASGTMTATDLELRISAPLGYDGPALLLPHARLAAIVGSLNPADEVTLSPDGTACTVQSGNGTWATARRGRVGVPDGRRRGREADCQAPG
jgi:DNA polymerase III sliding clamp (beta) subunit (PCNA family)